MMLFSKMFVILFGRRKGEAVQHLEEVHKLRAVVEEGLVTFELNIGTNGLVVVQTGGGMVYSFLLCIHHSPLGV